MESISQIPVDAARTAGEPLSIQRLFTKHGVHPFETVE